MHEVMIFATAETCQELRIRSAGPELSSAFAAEQISALLPYG